MQSSAKYWLGFNITKGLGPARIRALIDHFGDAQRVWHASEHDLAQAGLDKRTRKSLLSVRDTVDLELVLRRVRDLDVSLYHWFHTDYPVRLRDVIDSPPLLYSRGTIVETDQWAVALVGTRNPTRYGREVARDLATELARNGVTIVSGLARGIDTVAHQAAIDAGGRTLAVLGCGVDVIYPPENRKLAAAITEHGAMISDYPLGTKPDARNFPPRNRIISGLSLATVVIEAGARSGALITADFAAEHGRDVFAVPGSIYSKQSAGPNKLIRAGATPVLSVDDILNELDLRAATEHKAAREKLPTTDVENVLIECLRAEPLHADELSILAGMPIADTTSTLTMLELKGYVRNLGGMQYELIQKL